MENVLSTDLPPAYCTLTESTQKNADTVNKHSEVVIPTLTTPDNSSEPLVGATFENEHARMAYIIKVISIALMQVLASGFVIGLVSLTWICWNIRYNSHNLMVIASLFHLGTLVALFYCSEARKKEPYNYMFLVALPLTLAFSIVAFTCDIVLKEIFIAWIFYAVVMLALLFYCIFCLDSKVEFRVRNGVFITAGILTVLYVSVAPFSWYANPFTIFYLTLVVFLECSTLLYRLHAMTSRDYHHPISPSDYVNGALILQTDTTYMLVRFVKTMF